jgi:hypothetical protein
VKDIEKGNLLQCHICSLLHKVSNDRQVDRKFLYTEWCLETDSASIFEISLLLFVCAKHLFVRVLILKLFTKRDEVLSCYNLFDSRFVPFINVVLIVRWSKCINLVSFFHKLRSDEFTLRVFNSQDSSWCMPQNGEYIMLDSEIVWDLERSC